jgi:hypothetical protein
VKIIPIMISKKEEKKVLLNIQYRVPIQSFVIEFPAGLNDSDNIEQCVLKELKVLFYPNHSLINRRKQDM